ncbi:hypothetical protein V6N13_083100 [Hibiscus sabdariffa]
MSSFDGIPNRFHLTLFKIFIYRIPCRKPPNSRPKPQRHSWTTSERSLLNSTRNATSSVLLKNSKSPANTVVSVHEATSMKILSAALLQLDASNGSKKSSKIKRSTKTFPKKKLSIEPDLVSYNTVIKVFCDTGSLDSARLMLDEMEKKGVWLAVITFNTLLYNFCKNGRVDDGEKIWGKMAVHQIS